MSEKNIEDLLEELRQVKLALGIVMAWIDNWSPDFTDDPEWEDTEAMVKYSLLDSEHK